MRLRTTKDLITTRLDTSAERYVIVTPAHSSYELVSRVCCCRLVQAYMFYYVYQSTKIHSTITDISLLLVFSKPK